jgi:hypothetical protein
MTRHGGFEILNGQRAESVKEVPQLSSKKHYSFNLKK